MTLFLFSAENSNQNILNQSDTFRMSLDASILLHTLTPYYRAKSAELSTVKSYVQHLSVQFHMHKVD